MLSTSTSISSVGRRGTRVKAGFGTPGRDIPARPGRPCSGPGALVPQGKRDSVLEVPCLDVASPRAGDPFLPCAASGDTRVPRPPPPDRHRPGGAHPCRSPSAPRRRWSRCCPSVSSRGPASPAAASGAAALAEAGLFGEWLFCHNLQVSTSQRGSCWSPQADFKTGKDAASCPRAAK